MRVGHRLIPSFAQRLSIAALLCATAASAGAQTFVRDNPTLAKIWQIGMHESKV